jgi:hypothetical protein
MLAAIIFKQNINLKNSGKFLIMVTDIAVIDNKIFQSKKKYQIKKP